ncbi:MAG: hypothetical protein NTY15_05710 [Planctomycetota bacterium]|nr:hypothetical protein [Planctomycetota bacterium]
MKFARDRTVRHGNSSLPKMGFLLFILALAIAVLPKLRSTLEGRFRTAPIADAGQSQSDADGIDSIAVTDDGMAKELDSPPQADSTAQVAIDKIDSEADEDIALDGQTQDLLSVVIDNSLRMSKREMPAYWELVRKTSMASFQQLHQTANSKIKFNELYANPSKHRGELIARDIVVRRVTRYEAEPGNKAGVNGVYEIWGSTDQSHAWLYVFITDKLPEGFSEESILKKRMQFAGYFLKLLAYQPGSASPNAKPLLAPMLIGQLHSAAVATPIAIDDTPWWANWGLSSFIVLLATFLTLRVFLSGGLGRSKKIRDATRSSDRDFDSLWDEAQGKVSSSPAKRTELD